MARIRIFVSFDGDHDTDLHDLLYEQSTRPGSEFEFAAASERGAMTARWAATSRARICEADEVVVLCGEHTNESQRMAAELRIVKEEGKPYLLLWGRRERMCTMPDGAKPADSMYSWDLGVLENQMNSILRASNSQVPEIYKRQKS